ncbi:MAG: HNH endonuclease [Sedimentisphaerales bacterium]|nr:HNH endonuclease [Sedimentisphaerales bacterium]
MASNPDYPNQSEMIDPLVREIVKMGGVICFGDEGHLLEKALAYHFDLTEEQANRIDPTCNSKDHRAWRNHIQYVRLKAKGKGFLDCSERDKWKVTDSGYEKIDCSDLENTEIVAKTASGKQVEFGDIWSSPEGLEVYKIHKTHERDSAFIRIAKQRYLRANHAMKCEVCGFSFYAIYGDRGEGYIEAHHNHPISEYEEPVALRLDDIRFLCSNCHSMIHRNRPWLSVDDLIELIGAQT